jgi:hypothetical protein
MEEKNEGEVVELQEEVETLEEATTEEQDTTDWKAKYEEALGKLRRAETKLEKTKIEKKAEVIVEKQSKTGELDEAVRDFFDLKGYSDDEMEVFHKIMEKTGMSHREILKDEYAVAKVTAMRKAQEVKDATPSGTRRAGGQSSTDVDYWVAKVEQGGELPKDIELKRKVINRIAGKDTLHTPPWRR